MASTLDRPRVDTVTLSYPVYMTRSEHLRPGDDFTFTGKFGSKGLVRWSRWRHDSGIELTMKGIPGHSTVAIFDGSVDKALGLCGSAGLDELVLLDRWIRSTVRHELVRAPSIRRLDLCADLFDPDGDLRRAAIDWQPHARARYVQNVINDGQTVWLRNQSRCIRVYAKFDECGQEWARDLTRVEYQMRGYSLNKAGFDRVARLRETDLAAEIAPLVADLRQRVSVERSGE